MNEHFIPQFYQRQFIEDGSGLIWTYRPGEKPRKRTVRFTASEEDIYGAITEAKLGKRETKASWILRNLVSKERTLEMADKLEFATFLVSLQRRTPKFRAGLLVRSETHIRDTLEDESLDRLIYEFVWDPYVPLDQTIARARRFRHQARLYRKRKLQPEAMETAHATWFRELATGETSKAPARIAKMSWTFLKAPMGYFFVTSDAPFDSRGLEIREQTCFPLSKGCALQLSMEPQPQSYAEVSGEVVEAINREIVASANVEVYSGRMCPRLQQMVDRLVSDSKSA